MAFKSRLNRRELLVAGAAAGAGLALGDVAGAAGAAVHGTDFAAQGARDGWPQGWHCPGVANLRVSDGLGLLEAGSDVFPNDPRPVAFAVDARVRDATIRAVIARPGSAVGVVLRRTSPRDYYAAVYDVQRARLAIVRRSGTALVTLAESPVLAVGELTLELRAAGASPTVLTATLAGVTVTASDDHATLQRAGDPGVLSQARTLFPSAGPAGFPALGNFHLLPYGVQEGQAFIESPAGQQLIAEIGRQSTVAFRSVTVISTEAPQPTPAAVIAATTGLPLAGGARLHVAADLPATVTIEVAQTPAFEHPRRLAARRTGAFDAATLDVRGVAPGRAYWRASVRRAGLTRTGPVRSFAVPAENRVRLAVAACAAQFGPLFDDLVRRDPDVFVWQGDLNYPDTHGPLAQSTSGYAGIWRDFLANPVLEPVLARAAFVAVRDDHDYGAQDANSVDIPQAPWSLAPWDALLGDGVGYRFSAGHADVWVLDQRRFKSDPATPDDAAKTLLGERQRRWLLEGLATSTAPFKVICSPCTVFMPANRRDGNWAAGFTAERDALLAHIDAAVSGHVVFLTGDTHLTGVYDADGHFEVRACPLGIPVPNDVTLSNPLAGDQLRRSAGVAYADERCHYTLLDVHGTGDTATLEVRVVREDGTTPYRRTFTAPIPPPDLRVAIGPARRRALLRTGRLRVRVFLDRPGRVRLRARLRNGPRLARRAIRIRRPGTRRVTLRIRRRRLAVLRRPGRVRLTVRARYRSTISRATRRLRGH